MRVDNSVNDRVYPQKADFTFYGGIYRDVSLLVVNKNHIALGHFGDTGVKITPTLKEGSADIRVETLVEGSGTVTVELLDAEGRTVAKGEGENTFLHLDAPHLWNGVKDPYLYTCVVRLLQFRDLCPEGGVAAVMGAELLTVQQHGGAGVDTLELQPHLLLCRVVHRCCKAGAVGAAAPPVIVAAVLTVPGVPCMGQLYGGGNAVRAGKLPVLHELCCGTVIFFVFLLFVIILSEWPYFARCVRKSVVLRAHSVLGCQM